MNQKAFLVKSTAILISSISMVLLCACAHLESEKTTQRLPSNATQPPPPDATQQLPSTLQSTEGKLSSAQGMVMTKKGFYYFAPTGSTSTGWFSLDKQQYVKQFAGKTVKVSGYFNYDAKSITVVSLQVVGHHKDK